MFDGAVAEQPPRAVEGWKELATSAGFREPVGVEEQPVAGLEVLDPGLNLRAKSQWWCWPVVVQCDGPSAPQQEGRRVPTVDDSQCSPSLLDQSDGDEVLVADRPGDRLVQIGHDTTQIRVLIGDVSIGAQDDARQ